ncbi:MAG: TadE/TadG family type IV pilus assembly protein [Gemmataceae bacterium]
MNRRQSDPRRGVAAVELACLAPLLIFLLVITVDWARIFYYSVTIANCARNGAIYGSDTTAQSISPYTSIQQAALADANNLSPSPTVTSVTGTDANGNGYCEVTVSWQFTLVTSYPGIANPTTITRTVRMRTAPPTPSG